MEGGLVVGKKLNIFQRWMWLLELVPYSRKVFVVGSVARGTAKEESDIDFSIVAKKNRVWLNRVLLNLVLAVIGRRRSRRERTDRFCLNASWGGDYNFESSFFTRARTCLEFVLEITFLGPLFEQLTRKFFVSYIESRFHHFKSAPDTVIILENNLIIYYPPVLWKSGGLAVIDRWVYWANNEDSRTLS